MELAVARGDDPRLERRRPSQIASRRCWPPGAGRSRDPAKWWRRRKRRPSSAPGWSESGRDRPAKVFRSCCSGPMRPCTGPRSTPARARWVEAASVASCCSTATALGPAECGSRRSDWDWPTAPMPVCATCSAAPDRSCTERSWRPATGRTSTGQRRGEDRRPCAVLKLDWAERRDATGAPDRIRRPTGPDGLIGPRPRRGGCGRPPPPRR